MRNTAVAGLLFCLFASPLAAQDWAAVRALATDTPVRVQELGGTGGRVAGRIHMVEDGQLTLLVRGRPIVIPRASIRRLERAHRDPLWNGAAIGALVALAVRVASGGEACARSTDPQCTMKGLLMGAGLGAFIDYQIREHRVLYSAPPPTLTLLRLSF